MERFWLAILIGTTWLSIYLLGKAFPNLSAVFILLIGIALYVFSLNIAVAFQKGKQRLLNHIPHEPDVPDGYHPKVSIIIPAHNETQVIAQTVRMALAIDYPDYDVLVIDDRSTDNTAAVLQQLASQLNDNRLQIYTRSPETFPGKSAVLNEALTMTDGEVLCVFDADASVSPDFLKRTVPYLGDDKVGGVQVRKVIVNAEANWLTLCQNYEYSFDANIQCGRDAVRGAAELRGNGQLVKRKALADVDGWTQDTLTDDLDLSTKLHLAGWDIRFLEKVYVLEEGVTRFPALLRQRRRWAEGALVRYLEHFSSMLTSHKVSRRATADMVVYLVEFFVPLWLVTDGLLILLDLLFGDYSLSRTITYLLVYPLLALAFNVLFLIAILRFNQVAFHRALFGGLMTSYYMLLLWLPTAFYVIFKVLCQPKRTMDWGKTEHFGVSH